MRAETEQELPSIVRERGADIQNDVCAIDIDCLLDNKSLLLQYRNIAGLTEIGSHHLSLIKYKDAP